MVCAEHGAAIAHKISTDARIRMSKIPPTASTTIAKVRDRFHAPIEIF
jgi:hypothetical protein